MHMYTVKCTNPACPEISFQTLFRAAVGHAAGARGWAWAQASEAARKHRCPREDSVGGFWDVEIWGKADLEALQEQDAADRVRKRPLRVEIEEAQETALAQLRSDLAFTEKKLRDREAELAQIRAIVQENSSEKPIKPIDHPRPASFDAPEAPKKKEVELSAWAAQCASRAQDQAAPTLETTMSNSPTPISIRCVGPACREPLGRTCDREKAVEIARAHRCRSGPATFYVVNLWASGEFVGDCVDGYIGPIVETRAIC